MKNKPSAFQEVLNRVVKDSKLFGATGPGIPGSDLLQGALRIFTNAKARLDKSPQGRRAKESKPIATLKNGGTLFSDGTIKPSQSIPQGEQDTKTLLTSTTTRSTGPEVKEPGTPTEMLTREFMQALDAKNNAPNEATISQGATTEFYPGLRGKVSPSVLNGISGFLDGYTKPEGEQRFNPRAIDREVPSQYTASQNERVPLGPLRNSYGNLFAADLKGPNYSSINPTRNAITNLLRELEKENEFRG